MKSNLVVLSLIIFQFLCISKLNGQSNPDEDSPLFIYGFGRSNFVYDDQDLGRNDIFMPANIKVGAKKTPNFFIGAKQTRVGLFAKHNINNEILSVKIEGDFHNDASNANGLFRMRLAYANYRFILVGMAWSNFFDEDVNPICVDFEGPNSSTLSRTPQVRFSSYKSKNTWSISFENPIENIASSGTITTLPERFPDIIGAYRVNGNFGFIKIAALMRELHYESDKTRSLLGYGITLMSALKLGQKDKLKFQVVSGTGVARYIQGASGLNYDAVYNGTNELESLQMHGSNISYQHFWKEHINSSLTAGILTVEDNPNLVNGNYKTGYYASLNLFWETVKNLSFGAEVLYGERINMDDKKGSALRLQMNATYKFNKTIK